MFLKKYFWLFAKFTIALWIIIFLSKSNFLSFSDVALSIISPNNFVILPILMVAIVINSCRWFLLLRSQKINVSFVNCLKKYYIGYSFNFILPGGIAGDFIKISQIIKGSNRKAVAAISVILDKGLGLISCGLVILFLLPQKILIYYASALILFLCIIIFLLGKKIFYKKIISFFVKKNDKISLFCCSMIKGFVSYRKSKDILFINIFIAIFAQILVAFCLLLLGNNILGVDINLTDYLLSSITAQIAGIIPISPGGLGVEEATFANMLYFLNHKILLQYATIYLVLRIFSLIISIPAVIIFLTKRTKIL